METIFLKKLKKKLETHKRQVEKELKKLAQIEKKALQSSTEAGTAKVEAEIEETEEFYNISGVQESLSKKLKEINLALKKIKSGKYGICEKCKKEIEKERLNILPEARSCRKCK